MRKLFTPIIALAFFAFSGNAIYAQLTPADSTLLSSSIQNAIDLHNETAGESIHLYNAAQNESYNHLAIGHPYFIADSIQIGALFYDGIYYQNVPMMYDLQSDNVLILKYGDPKELPQLRSIIRLDLIRSRIAWFFLPGHEFTLLTDSNAAKLKGGFYDKAYDGHSKLFIKRTKVYVEEIKNGELERRYNPKDFYYIQKDGVYYNVKNKKTLLNVFKDKRSQISSYMKKNGLKFKKTPEKVVTYVTRYYDQLKN